MTPNDKGKRSRNFLNLKTKIEIVQEWEKGISEATLTNARKGKITLYS